MTTGEKIKRERLRAGFTQSDLARILKIPYQSISQYERGLRNPKNETLMKIADALGINVFVLYDDDLQNFISTFQEPDDPSEQEEDLDLETIIFQQHLERPIRQDAEKKLLYRLGRDDGYTFSENEKNIVSSLAMLNDTGQQEALKRIQELTEIPRYQRTKAGEDPDA